MGKALFASPALSTFEMAQLFLTTGLGPAEPRSGDPRERLALPRPRALSLAACAGGRRR